MEGTRYRLRQRLGSGTMGTVYRAFDPQLNRTVAIKTMNGPGRAGSVTSTFGHSAREARGRFAAEARAMAALSHPNVVAVYDAGMRGSTAFLAMELVEGKTLQAWLETPRGWREIVDVFVQAGRGLAAAHAHGMVHRDFKPANVLVGDDGRVRVTDFGLVTMAGDCSDTLVDGRVSLVEDEDSFTQTGMSVGTPAYMAPEQHYGCAVDERADQFAFCVALFEALFGARPFRAKTHHDLARRKHLGRISTTVAGRDVPGWLEKIVRRGLRAEPDDRFETMTDLVEALEQGTRRSHAKRGRTAKALMVAAVLASTAAAACVAPTAQTPAGKREPDGDVAVQAELEAAKAEPLLPLSPRLKTLV